MDFAFMENTNRCFLKEIGPRKNFILRKSEKIVKIGKDGY